jgi:hypothetical protein
LERNYLLKSQSLNQESHTEDFNRLVESVIKAVLKVGQSQNLEEAIVIRNELRRLPDGLLTEVLNQVMLHLVWVNPLLCRWFIVDVFLRNAPAEGKADVAERINLLMADLQSS